MHSLFCSSYDCAVPAWSCRTDWISCGFPSQRDNYTKLSFYFDVKLNKLLNKQSSCWDLRCCNANVTSLKFWTPNILHLHIAVPVVFFFEWSWDNGTGVCYPLMLSHHDDVTKWKHFPRYWCFVRGIHRSPANSPHKGQWRGTLTFSLICAWTNG